MTKGAVGSRAIESSSLLVRLRRALGLTGLAGFSLGSGPCGSCPEDYERCNTIDEIVALRDDPVNANALIASWNPEDGCPTVQQFNSLARLDGEEPVSQRVLLSTDAQCCYVVTPDCPGGRPFGVDGRPRRASLLGELPETADPLERAIAESYAQDGLMEHASVASFARLTLALLAWGAPHELIRDAQQGALDELRHAEFCFAQAGRHGECVFAAGALAMDRALDDLSLEWLIEANLIEGCIGETLAAARVAEQARLARDAALCVGLSTIAEDEARHAELAWRVLRWTLELAPELVRQALQRIAALGVEAGAEGPFDAAPRWSEAGRLSRRDAAEIDRLTWQQILHPLFQEIDGRRRPSPAPIAGALLSTRRGTLPASRVE